MAAAVLLEFAGELWLCGPELPTAIGGDHRSALAAVRARFGDGSPEISAGTASLAVELATTLGRTVPVASLEELRAARSRLPIPPSNEERPRLLTAAREALTAALQDPEEILITLAREEERVERAVGREARAAESFVDVPEAHVRDYARRWADVRSSFERHHEALQRLVRERVRAVAPNLAAVVGERTAARLISEAGGVAALARMRAGRIQLLGSRRRPSAERGPRYGLLYRADGMEEVPSGRRGAYARSLGALAAIAARADATTRSAIAPTLVARRSRRIAQLRGRPG